MKKILTLLSMALVFSSAFAQDFCGTVMPEEDLAWLRNYKMNSEGPYYNKTTDDFVYIPVKVHIVGTDNGANYYRYSDLLNAFCTLNEQFAPYGWQFYIFENINYINNSDLYYHTQNTSYGTTINNACILNVVNIFFLGFDPNGYNVCGYYSRSNGPRAGSGQPRQGMIAINKGCAEDGNSTIAHELGHFFSLPHTFFGWEGRSATASPRVTDERANGSNCRTSGDYFCDTPADFLSDRWNCPYNLTKNDFLGTPYNPDGALYMSYANDNCQNYFSLEQVDAMRANLSQERPYLLQPVGAFTAVTDTANLICPALGTLNVPANQVALSWDPVPGATHYHLQCTRSPNPNIWALDTIVEANFVLVSSLQAGFTYRWRVKGFNKYATCAPYSVFSTFSTGIPTSLSAQTTIQPVRCKGSFDGSISLDINGGQGPYAYSWTTGESTPSATYLEGGLYSVTVTDNNSESLVLCFYVTEPDTLKLEVAVDSNLLLAQPTGGTPPFVYQWSSGETTPGIDPVTGEYSVTVTDANGCFTSKSYSYVGLSDVDAATKLRVYPNPTAGAQAFSIELTVPQPVSATVEVVDNAGRQVFQSREDFASGINLTQVPVSQLSPGVYFVRIVSQQLVKTTKILVY